jgi:hypothetical protein
MPAHFHGLAQVHQHKVVDIGSWDFIYIYTCLLTLRIGECCTFNVPQGANNLILCTLGTIHRLVFVTRLIINQINKVQ